MEHKYNLTQGLLEKIKIIPTCVWRRQQNMLERSKGLTDWSKHHIQEIQGIRPHVSDRPSDQTTQLGLLSHLDYRYHKKNYNSVQCRLRGENLCFYVGTTQRISAVMTSFLIVPWC
jgi:hypothetical protein